jgi:hypothetical protein
VAGGGKLENLVLLVVVIVIVVIALRVFGGPGGMDMFRRARHILARDQPTSPTLRQPTIEDLRPGDAVSFWDGQDDVVESVVQCREEIDGRPSTWRWAVLSSGQVLETAPDNNALYTQSTVFEQGSEAFYTLTAEPEHGGALKVFEARVRDESIAREPVSVTLDGKPWTVESTGTFSASYVGPQPRREVWRDISENPADNVYFELRGESESSALGIWTTHILLLQGRPLGETDIRSLYPGEEERK